ncbi:MFS general substrate transporter [Pisolithus albus]|nr:MFS general substrate transporter [Pisolithus albus]
MEHEQSIPCDRELSTDKGSLPATMSFQEGDFLSVSAAIGAFLVQICSYGYTTSFGVYQAYYTQYYLTNQSPSAISWIGSTNAFLFDTVGLISGRLYDLGYFYHLLIGGSVLQAFSLFMLSLAKPGQYYQVFLAQGVCSGCASGLIFVPTMAVLSQHFKKHLAPVMTLLGFSNGVRASAGFISGLLFLGCLLMRTRSPPSHSATSFISAATRCVHDSAYLLGVAGLFFYMLWYYYPLFYLQLDSQSHGTGETFSFYSLVIMNASSFMAQFTSGMLVKKVREDTLLIIAGTGCTGLLFSMAWIKTLPGFVAIGVLYGFFSGSALALWGPILALLTPDYSELGVRMGVASAIMVIRHVIGSPISGVLLTSNYIWWRGAVFTGVSGN